MGLFGFNAEKKLKKANEYLAKGIYYDARIAFEEILVRDNVQASITGQAREGWRMARRAMMEQQTSEAKRLVQAGEPAQALECCLAAVEQAGEDLDAGEAKQLLERLQEGETGAAKLLAGLDDIPALDDLPVEEGNEEQAMAVGPDAIFDVLMESLTAEQAETYRGFGPDFRKGFLELQEGNAEAALDAFARVSKEAQEHPFFRLEKAQALRYARKSADALVQLDGLELPDELNRKRLELKVVLLQDLERGEEAVKEARGIWEADKEDHEAAVLYAETLLENDHAQEALDVIMPFHKGRPVPEIDTIVVRCYGRTGKIQEARDLLEGTVEGFFQSPGGLHARFPVWAARELLQLYVSVGEDPERVRSLVQHMISHDAPSAEQYKQVLAKYVELREKGK